MDGLALKLVLTPTLIGAVSLAGRRWGPGVSGWLVGFPLTSGPVAFFLALDHGLAFAAAAAVGSMTGAAAQAVFCVIYGRLARGRHWAAALVGGSLGFAAATIVLQLITLGRIPLLALVITTLAAALCLMPSDSSGARPAGAASRRAGSMQGSASRSVHGTRPAATASAICWCSTRTASHRAAVSPCIPTRMWRS